MPRKPKRPPMTSVLFARLSDEDYNTLSKIRLLRTGATGRGRSKGYEPYGPFIASIPSELPRALEALGWTHTVVIKNDSQWVVTKERRIARQRRSADLKF